MNRKTKRGSRWFLRTSPWIIVGSVVILLIIVIVLAAQNASREKKYMSRILWEKGVALIKAVEAGTRTGMMDKHWGEQQEQKLLEETAQLSDVLFLTVINRDGLVLAHSDRNQIGSRFAQNLSIVDLVPADGASYRLVEMGRYGRSFLVYSYFSPVSSPQKWMNRGMHCMGRKQGRMSERRGNCSALSNDIQRNRIIIIGLNPEPFDEARQEDIRNTIIISGVLVLLGLAGFISMFWMHNYWSTKRALQDTTAFSNEVVSNLPVGLIATDKNGRIAFFNSAAERITSIQSIEALGKAPESMLPSHLCGFQEILNHGEAISEEERECEFSEGTLVPVSVSASKIVNEDGNFVGHILILRDLGEVRRLQAEIRRQEKLAAIGGLAAGVAHEIRNPLSSIKGIAAYYKNKFEKDSEDMEMAEVMIEEVDRVNRVISELLELARPTKLNLKSSDLNTLVQHSVRLVQQEAKAKNVHIKMTLLQESKVMDVDPDRITQCLLNLYLNALQAMENGGQLEIISSFTDDDSVNIDVGDNGIGIRTEDLSKIFDPYFTTKPRGTGLGLAIVQKIVEAHQGKIKVRSTSGRGSVFSIILPLRVNG